MTKLRELGLSSQSAKGGWSAMRLMFGAPFFYLHP
jgi:hypothetical protein